MGIFDDPSESKLLTTVFLEPDVTALHMFLNGYGIQHFCQGSSLSAQGVQFYVPASIFEDATALVASLNSSEKNE